MLSTNNPETEVRAAVTTVPSRTASVSRAGFVGGMGKLDFKLALICANASKAVYNSASIDTPLAHALILNGPDHVLVDFRGTKSIRDVITDADFIQRDLGYGKVHRGVDDALNSIFDLVLDQVERLDKPIVCGGHSLGGGITQRFAERINNLHLPVHSVYTFGQLRIYDPSGARFYDSVLGDRTFRFVHEEDIVPRIPWLLGSYRHAGHECFCSSISAAPLIVDPSLWRKIESDAWGLFNAWRAQRSPLFLDDVLRDHHIDNYVSTVAALSLQNAN